MYIATIPNRNSPPAILLRESYRKNGKVKTRTIANLSKLPNEAIEALRAVLAGKKLVEANQTVEAIASPQHGHVRAVMRAMKRLKFEQLIASRASKERDLVVAMVAARILQADSKLATTRWWHSTTLPDLLGVSNANEDALYESMDWLLRRQSQIERKLADRHLKKDGLVLYDLTSSYFEGVTCPLAAFGHNRDGKKGKLQVNYGILTDGCGRPIAVSVFEGNTADGKTLMPQVMKVQKEFDIDRFVLVGDRGMISQKLIEEQLSHHDTVEWISALRSGTIRELVQDNYLQLGLFDERDLFEFTCPDYPGERFIACRNKELGKQRAHKRKALIDATIKELERVRLMVEKARLKREKAKKKSTKKGRFEGKDQIGLRIGKIINKYKMAKHFILDIRDDGFDFHIDESKVATEAALDGLYVVRTSVTQQQLSTEEAVRGYKSLTRVEQAFRCLKSIDLKVRPIRHYQEQRVRAHIFLCMLAYYVQWHMLEAWRPLLFADEDTEAKKTRDPIAPAKRSKKALHKVHSKQLEDGTEVHSFRTLLGHLSEIVRNECIIPGAPADTPTFDVITIPNAKQQQAYDLLETITIGL